MTTPEEYKKTRRELAELLEKAKEIERRINALHLISDKLEKETGVLMEFVDWDINNEKC